MTVKELKNFLKKFDDNLDVYLPKDKRVVSIDLIVTKRVLNGKIVDRPCKETKGAKKCVILF